MRLVFNEGDVKTHEFQVGQDDIAKFESGMVHPVCSTFSLAREIEWSSRLFVLDMLEEGEEGVGTLLEIEHQSPALVGFLLTIEAVIEQIEVNEVLCSITVTCDNRAIARGRTGQKILNKERFNKNLSRLAGDGEG